jgi:hypothetical protein
MNVQLEEKIAGSLHERLGALAVPELELAQISGRSHAAIPSRKYRQPMLVFATCAAIALVIFITSGSANALAAKMNLTFLIPTDVMARVFGKHHRGRIELVYDSTYKDSTLAQARRELPFPIVTPAALPTGFHLQSVQTGPNKSVALYYVSAYHKGHASSRIDVVERAPKANDRTRDIAEGGFSFSGGSDGAIRNATVNDPKRYRVLEFTVGRTYVHATFNDFDKIREIMQKFKTAMGIPPGT